jgi:tetratricopeptide (TPR) repeat protein
MPDRESLARGTDAEVWALLEAELKRLGRADPFQALGLGYEADESSIRQAFLTATKVFHPNRFARRDREVLRVANEVYLRVKQAYQAIEQPDHRSQVLAKLGKGSASQRAVSEPPGTDRTRAVGTSPPARAATAPPRAAKARPPTAAPVEPPPSVSQRVPVRRETTAADVAQQVIERQRAAREELNLAKQQLLDGKLEDARKRIHALAAEHPGEKLFRAWLHYAIGRQREAASDHERARTEYRRALELDEAFAEARHAMERLPKEAPGGGLFSRLFRK